MAQRGDDFHCHVAGSLYRPFVVLLQQDSAREAEDGGFVGEDAHHIGAPLDFSIEPLDGIVGVDLGPVVFREGGVTGAKRCLITGPQYSRGLLHSLIRSGCVEYGRASSSSSLF